jgi:hypothetical protein
MLASIPVCGTWTVIALLGFNPERFAQLIVNLLAVGGGFLFGFLLSGLFLWLFDRWLFGGRLPDAFYRAWKTVGGIAMAALVAIIVFGHGEGWTLFGGGGTGPENRAPGESQTASPTTPATVPEPPSDAEPIAAPRVVLPKTDRIIQITMLGGEDVKNQRFYLVDSDPVAKSLAEVQAIILARKAESPPNVGLGLLIRFSAANVLPRTHPAVVILSQWAQDHGVAVTFPADKF